MVCARRRFAKSLQVTAKIGPEHNSQAFLTPFSQIRESQPHVESRAWRISTAGASFLNRSTVSFQFFDCALGQRETGRMMTGYPRLATSAFRGLRVSRLTHSPLFADIGPARLAVKCSCVGQTAAACRRRIRNQPNSPGRLRIRLVERAGHQSERVARI